jgi:hypothetical protein
MVVVNWLNLCVLDDLFVWISVRKRKRDLDGVRRWWAVRIVPVRSFDALGRKSHSNYSIRYI